MVVTPKPLQGLAESDAMFRTLVASVKDYAIFILDPTGRVVTWNAGAERFKGYTEAEIVGQHFSTFYPQRDVVAGKCEMELEVASREGRFEDEGWRVRKDGTEFWANVVITALHDPNGGLIGFGKVTRDLTERKRSEEERTARIAAEHANRAKDEFLAMLGHELRNPLAPIVSAVQLLKLRGDAKLIRELLVIERQTRQMTRIVDDLLDVSRISQGKIVLQCAAVDLRDVIAKAAEIAIPMIEKKGQRFEVSAPPRPMMVHGDDGRLVQVFTNLLTNASKYTPEGGHIYLMIRQPGNDIVVEVRDDGIGIAPELLRRVFELFVQGHQGSDRPDSGLGLGLTLVRALVELHGGKVEARSAGPGLGSSFVVRLAATEAVPAAADERIATAYAASSGKRRILLVDDNQDARDILADLLSRLGHDVRAAGDGPSALAQLDGFEAQVAVLDIGLPGMDGCELAERIRERHGDIRLVALSGYSQPIDHARTHEAGFSAHLVKPIDVQTLLDHILAIE